MHIRNLPSFFLTNMTGVRSDSDSDLREVGLILSSLEVLSELGKDLIDTECRDF